MFAKQALERNNFTSVQLTFLQCNGTHYLKQKT